MTGRDAVALAVPGAVSLAAAGVPLALGRADYALAAGFAVLLTVPPAYLTLWAARRMMGRSPFGGLLGMAAGVPVRVGVAVGGGVLVFFGTKWFESAKLAFWFWLLGTYILTLAAETVLLAGSLRPAKAATGGPAGRVHKPAAVGE